MKVSIKYSRNKRPKYSLNQQPFWVVIFYANLNELICTAFGRHIGNESYLEYLFLNVEKLQEYKISKQCVLQI